MSKMTDWLFNRGSQAEEAYEDENYYEPEEAVQEPDDQMMTRRATPVPGSNVVNLHAGVGVSRIVIEKPTDFECARKVIDHLKNRRPVVINIEPKEVPEAQRLVDFISGAVYALDGHIQKVSRGIFVLAPSNVEIALDEGEENGSAGGSGSGSWNRYYDSAAK